MSKPTDHKETKRERFARVATARVNKVISMLRLLGNCADPAVYAYTDDEVRQVFEALVDELNKVRARFAAKTGKKRTRFSLSAVVRPACNPVPEYVLRQDRVVLPDGSVLSAAFCSGSEFPAIQIFLERPGADEKELICFAEYNHERDAGHELCIGAYCFTEVDTVYYDSYVLKKEEGE